MIRFLQIGQAKNRSRQNLKNFLILLLRCLIVVLIAILFAGPRLLTQAPPVKNTTACYLALDDSLSMAYRDGGSSYFDTMIERTKRYIASAKEGCSYNLYAMSSGKKLSDASKHEAEIFLKKLRVNPGEAGLTEFLEGIKNARTAKDRPEKVYAFLASDFTPRMMEQLTRTEISAAVDDLRYEKIETTRNIDNMAITEASAILETDRKLLMNVTVVNYGRTDRKNRLAARLNGKPLGEIAIDLPAGQQRTFTLDALPIADRLNQWLPITLHLEKPDGLGEDDTFYLPIRIPENKHLRIVLVGNDAREIFLLRTALDTLDTEETQSVRSVLFSQFTDSDLSGADIVIFTSLSSKLKAFTGQLQTFVQNGGKVVYFVKECSVAVVEAFSTAGILPALPHAFQSETIRLEPSPSAAHLAVDSESAAGALQNYKMDRIVFSGYFDCQPSSEGVCTWRFQNQAGFVYIKQHGKGVTVLVNTSPDDSHGMLMKSPAAVPFCRYLLGQEDQLEENKITIGEPIIFPCEETQDTRVGIFTPGGRKMQAASSHSSAIANCSEEIGFFQTDEPACYAGVNPIAGETNMAKADDKTLGPMLKQMFPLTASQPSTPAAIVEARQYKPIWKYFAWIIIVLITAEAFITNRMQR
jgi:putative component of toxin-antitoxin plasmid stabilization module